MPAVDYLRSGDLEKALAAVKDDVRRDPNVFKHRVFLFQLFAIVGDWDRAETQLKVAGELSPEALHMLNAYRPLIKCEGQRKSIFEGASSPTIFGQPEEWIAFLTEALRLLAQGHVDQASTLRDKALELAPASSGTLLTGNENDNAIPDSAIESRFEWIADGDDRLGPMLEAVINGRYFWVPFSRIRALKIDPPADLRDFVWTPADFEWTNGGQTVGFIPTRYQGSESSGESRLRLARATIWEERAPGLFSGLGQRILVTDIGEHSLMDIRRIQFDVPQSSGSSP
jgi:type VI secretion system protein ImpE